MVTSLAHHSNFTSGDLERFMGLSIGFDSMFNRLANFPQQPEGGAYPPYNIRKEDDYNFVIEIALAGFSEKISLSLRLPLQGFRKKMLKWNLRKTFFIFVHWAKKENKIWIHQITFIEELRIALSLVSLLWPMTLLSGVQSFKMVFLTSLWKELFQMKRNHV